MIASIEKSEKELNVSCNSTDYASFAESLHWLYIASHILTLISQGLKAVYIQDRCLWSCDGSIPLHSTCKTTYIYCNMQQYNYAAFDIRIFACLHNYIACGYNLTAEGRSTSLSYPSKTTVFYWRIYALTEIV